MPRTAALAFDAAATSNILTVRCVRVSDAPRPVLVKASSSATDVHHARQALHLRLRSRCDNKPRAYLILLQSRKVISAPQLFAPAQVLFRQFQPSVTNFAYRARRHRRTPLPAQSSKNLLDRKRQSILSRSGSRRPSRPTSPAPSQVPWWPGSSSLAFPPPGQQNTASGSGFFSGQSSRVQLDTSVFEPQSRRYHLEVIQHPLRTAEFGTASLSRLPLAPPLVVQLTVRDRDGNSLNIEAELPFLVAHLSLFNADGSNALDVPAVGGHGPQQQRLLYGTLVASPHVYRSMQGRPVVYFIFADVSIRSTGRFRLGVSLMSLARMGSSGMVGAGESGALLAQVRTRPFDVVAHSEYSAPPQTHLTQFLLQQGARMTSSK